jgi:hypothetical protein
MESGRQNMGLHPGRHIGVIRYGQIEVAGRLAIGFGRYFGRGDGLRWRYVASWRGSNSGTGRYERCFS